MISVAEVDRIIFDSLLDIGTEKLPLPKAIGRVLKEEVRADRDFPPFDRVMMDGIGIRYADWQAGRLEFKIAGLSAAGSAQQVLEEAGHCLEVMTGAVMPKGLDTVVKYEEINIENGVALINNDHQIGPVQHVHTQGTDRRAGSLLM